MLRNEAEDPFTLLNGWPPDMIIALFRRAYVDWLSCIEVGYIKPLGCTSTSASSTYRTGTLLYAGRVPASIKWRTHQPQYQGTTGIKGSQNDIATWNVPTSMDANAG